MYITTFKLEMDICIQFQTTVVQSVKSKQSQPLTRVSGDVSSTHSSIEFSGVVLICWWLDLK